MTEHMIYQRNLELLKEKELYFGPETLVPPSLSGAMENQQGQAPDLQKINAEHAIMLVNEQNLEIILKAEQQNDPYCGKFRERTEFVPMLPFYLYFCPEEFAMFLTKNDVASLCKRYRVVILVGQEIFYQYFSQIDVVMPAIVLGTGAEEISGKLYTIQQKKIQILTKMELEVCNYYAGEGGDIRARIAQGKAKTCILKNYFEPNRFQKLYYHLKESLERKGCEVLICNERGPVYRMPEIVFIYLYKPDLIVQINKSRKGRAYHGEKIRLEFADQMFFVNWVQDIHPAVLDQKYASSLKKNDFIFSLFDEHIMQGYGFPKENVIYGGIMPADQKVFHPCPMTEEEHQRYDCDICFVGLIMTDEMTSYFICDSLNPYLNDEEIGKTAELIFQMLDSMYDAGTGNYQITLEELNNYVDCLQKELNFSQEARLNVFRVFSVVRYNSLRKLILRQLAARGTYRIKLYGECDIGVQGVQYGGYLSDSRELSKALQCSKIVMQVNPDATMNQRVVEALLSHTMVMVFQMDKESDMSNIGQYLKEQEGICYFENKNTLFEKCDFLLKNQEEREKIAENGYQKAVETLSTDAVFGYLLERLKEKAIETQRL